MKGSVQPQRSSFC